MLIKAEHITRLGWLPTGSAVNKNFKNTAFCGEK